MDEIESVDAQPGLPNLSNVVSIESGKNNSSKEARQHQELRIDTIRSYERSTLVRELVRRAEIGWVPDLDMAKALLCVYARDIGRKWDFDDEERSSETYDGKDLPWPERANQKNEFIVDNEKPSSYGEPVASSELFGDLFDFDDYNALTEPLSYLVSGMNQEDVSKLASFVYDNYEKFSKYTVDIEEIKDLIEIPLNNLDHYGQEAIEVGQRMISLIDRYVTDKAIVNTSEFDGQYGDDWKILFISRLSDHQDLIYRALVNADYEEETRNRVIGVLMRSSNVPRELNQVRGLMENERLPQEEKDRHEQLLKDMLGLLAGDVYTNLDDLYAAIKFEEYPLSKLNEQKRIEQIQDVFSRYKVDTNARILDLGSGTGWITEGIRDLGYKRVLGMDKSERNTQVAKTTHGDRFAIADWTNMPYPRGAMDVVVSQERNLPHTEEESNFWRVIEQVYNTLDDGGLFIFDMPNPEKGSYKEHLDNYRDLLRKFGFSEREIQKQWYIVDSPDGENFYNRYVPSEQEIIWRVHRYFDIEEVIIEDIPNGKGDENMTFICRKPSVDKHQRLNSILSGQYPPKARTRSVQTSS